MLGLAKVVDRKDILGLQVVRALSFPMRKFCLSCHIIFACVGISGWGISWYLNGLLIPRVELYRGFEYTFIIEGGSDPSNPARYHPFYITSSDRGGLLVKSAEERKVRSTSPAHQSEIEFNVDLTLSAILHDLLSLFLTLYRKRLCMLGLMQVEIHLEVIKYCLNNIDGAKMYLPLNCSWTIL